MNSFARSTSRIAVIFATALIGAGIAIVLKIPLPWMLGPLVVSAIIALRKLEIFGEIPVVPRKMRDVFVPIIGLMIGSRVTPDTLVQAGQWWPSLLLVIPFAFVTQIISFWLLLKLGRYDKPTAYFSASPGGVVEAALISERFNGDPARTVVQHLARISLAVTVIPVLLTLYIGHTVGSSSGITMELADNPLGLKDIALLAAGAFAGAYAARKINLPAGNMLGPLIASAILHATGLTAAMVPTSLVQLTQLVIGASLGGRFAAVDLRTLYKGALYSLPLLAVSLSVAAIAGYLVSVLGYNSGVVGFISFAPGGVTEMSLIAVSIDADPVYVACHHVVRIFTAVLLLPLVYRFFIARE